MTLCAGTRVGPYEVLALLGAGGMGEVYRARDTKLGRDVAIKILPEAMAGDANRLARFRREAQVLASLNHPNIAQLHGLEDADGTPALVMELVEGPTLADRIAQGPVPPGEALLIARQIAQALDAAHEQHVVHRDLKPANIKLKRDGTVKVLDFGLAKATRPGAEPPSVGTASSTETLVTRVGAVVGTTAYMSPEQARGQTVDHRTDVWAFGCVLYELLTGRAPFKRETSSDTIAAIITQEPDWPVLPAGTPPAVARMLGRCLDKDPHRRLRHIGDARAEIDDAIGSLSGASGANGVAPGVPARSGPWRLVLPVTGLIAAVALVAWWAAATSTRVPADPLADAHQSWLTDWEGTERQAVLSPDGRFVAFVSDRSGTDDVWVTQLGTNNSQNLTGGDAGELYNPAVRLLGFSPDSALVTLWGRRNNPARGVETGGWAVPTLGGPIRPYMDRYRLNVAEFAWSPDFRRLVYHTSDEDDPTFVTDDDSTAARQIIADEGFHNHFPVFAPDGRTIYFVRGDPQGQWDVWRVPVTGGEPERLTTHASRVLFPTFLDARTLLYLASAEDGTGPWIHSLDVETLESTRLNPNAETYSSLSATADGSLIVATATRSTSSLWRAPLTSSVVTDADAERMTLPTTRGQSPRVGPGYMVYVEPAAGAQSLWKVDDDGATHQLWDGADGRVVTAPAIDPAGQHIAFVVQRGDAARLHVMDADRSGLRLLAGELDVRGAPSWSPDGQWIAIAAYQNGVPVLYKIPSAGGAAVRLTDDWALDPEWAPSGNMIVFSGRDVGTTFDIRAVSAEGQDVPFPDLTLSRGARRLRFLGDDDTLVFLRGDIGHRELAVFETSSGIERALTGFGRELTIADFDIGRDGRTIIVERTRELGDLLLFERPKG